MIVRELSEVTTQSSDTIRRCMHRIGKSQFLFQLVVDDEGRLVGVVTDGDIRRALMSGTDLDEGVLRCVNKKPVVAASVTEANSLLDLVGTRPPRWIPVLNDDLRPVCVLVDIPADAGLKTALVMAGGFGRRLGEMTRSVPKPLLPINGRPILDHILRRLARDGIERAFVSTHYLSSHVEEYVRTLDLNLDVVLLEETKPLGTAGAIGLVAEDLGEPLLVINGDVLTNTDIGALFDSHRAMGNNLTVAAAMHRVTIPYGVLQCDEKGYVLAVAEKPVYDFPISAGIYLVDEVVARLVKKGDELAMPELISMAIAAGHIVGLFGVHEYWIDVGRPDDFALAERDHQAWSDSDSR